MIWMWTWQQGSDIIIDASLWEVWKDSLSEDHCLLRKFQQGKIPLITIINMDQNPKTSTIILIHQYQVLPKIHLSIINLKWIQSTVLNHMTTAILHKIRTITLALYMHTKNTSYKMMKKRKYLIMWMRTKFMNKN